MNNYCKALCAIATLALPLCASADEETAATKIARALTAAPANISKDATIMDVDGTILQKGTNGWTCLPGAAPGDKTPMCNDAVWMKMMHALMSKAEFSPTAMGISYMLKGDAPGGGVSNSDPFNPDPKAAADYVEEGPHLMIIVPRELLKGITDDPKSGGPYVMWGNTPYAHIMVPVSDK